MNQIKMTCAIEGRPWSSEGTRHDQVFSIRKVPYVAQEATMDPRYQDEL